MLKSMPFDRAYPFAVFFSQDHKNYAWFNAYNTRKAAIRIARAGLDSETARANFAIVVDMRNKSTIRKLQAPTLRFYMRIPSVTTKEILPFAKHGDLHLGFLVSGKKSIESKVVELLHEDERAQDAIRTEIIEASNDPARGLTENLAAQIAEKVVAEKLSIDTMQFDIRCIFTVKGLQHKENTDGTE